MEATDFNFVSRTNNLNEGGGYETWSFTVDGQKFSLFCDIRIPGIVNSFYEDLPSDRSKVCMTDIISVDSDNVAGLYDPSQSIQEVQEAIIEAVVKILLEKIKPVRNFKYVNFVYSKNNKHFFNQIFNLICADVTDSIKEQIYRIITPDAQLLIDAGQFEFLSGELK